jgi:hypothetical protein
MAKRTKPEDVGATLTPAEIKRGWDKMSKRRERNTEVFIAAGRGYERPSDYLDKTDPLSIEARTLASDAIFLESEARKYAGADYKLVIDRGSRWDR